MICCSTRKIRFAHVFRHYISLGSASSTHIPGTSGQCQLALKRRYFDVSLGGITRCLGNIAHWVSKEILKMFGLARYSVIL